MPRSRTVSRAELLSQLEAVSHGLSQRDIIEQSSCFVFDDGYIMTYNDQVACRQKTSLDITGAVQAMPLKRILEKMPEDEVELITQDAELLVIGKRRKSGIRMENEVLLPIDKVDTPKKFKPLHEDFVEAVTLARESTGKDLNKFWTTCVHLHPKWIEACDNFQVTRFRLKTGVNESTLVPSSAISSIVGLDVVKFCETDNWIHFKNKHGLIISCRRYIEKYPHDGVAKLLKVSGRKTSLPKGLAEACERAEIFSSENTDNNQVQVMLAPGKIRIKGEGVSGWFTELKKLRYKGPAMDFLIGPKLLMELTRRHNECEVSESHLKVNGGHFVYVASLSMAGDPDNDEEQEDEEGGEDSDD